MYFGTIVIGEKLVRKIQLINKGALGTNFEIMKMQDYKKLTETSENKETSEQNFPEDGIELGEVS